MNVISNTTVISNFASIGQLEMLHRLYGNLYISTAVYEEIQTGLEEGYLFYSGMDKMVYPIVADGWIRLTNMEDDQELHMFGKLLAHLHYGEASCLAIASCRHWLILTDDRAARKEADQKKIALSGSLGCLVFLVKRTICSLEQANFWLGKMIEQGYHSPVADLSSFNFPGGQ